MPICLGIPRPQTAGERRVALTPETAKRLLKFGVEIVMQQGAGESAYFTAHDYEDVRFFADAKAVYDHADILLRIDPPSLDDVAMLREGSTLIGLLSPHNHLPMVQKLCEKQISSFAMELIPRISRAQSMDVLSSQAAVAGYKAVIMAADRSSVFFPMLTTAAGTVRPAKVLVIGAGVAGLQAIATARRLGAIVEGYDVRSATREQVESLGAKFVDMPIRAEAAGGYARELTHEEQQQQQDALASHIAAANVVITTAAIPGRPSPKIITQAMVEGMQAGSVIIDLASEGGGNCELTKEGETIEHQQVIVHGPLNVPSQVPRHASEMYARNVFNFLSLMLDKEGHFTLDWNDEIIAGSALTYEGEVKHVPTQTLLASES